jgi:hypothetical protein
MNSTAATCNFLYIGVSSVVVDSDRYNDFVEEEQKMCCRTGGVDLLEMVQSGKKCLNDVGEEMAHGVEVIFIAAALAIITLGRRTDANRRPSLLWGWIPVDNPDTPNVAAEGWLLLQESYIVDGIGT